MMNRIKELRQENKFSQIELANKVHASNQAISAYESGTREPKEPMWQALADFFNVSVPYLKGYMVCTRCKSWFIPDPDCPRDLIQCCSYCMNPYFEGDKK